MPRMLLVILLIHAAFAMACDDSGWLDPGVDPRTGTLCNDGDPDTIGDIWLGGECVGYKPWSCVGDPCDSYNGCTCGNTFCAGIIPNKTCQRLVNLDHRGGINVPQARTMDSDAGTNLLAIVWGDVVRVMETNTWHEVRSFAAPIDYAQFDDVALSPDGAMVTGVGDSKTITIYAMADMHILHEFDDEMNTSSVQFHPNNKIMALGGCVEHTVSGSCTAGQLLLYDLDNIDTPRSVDIGGNVSDIQFSNDGSVIAISYDEKDWQGSGGLWIANTDTLEPLWEETLGVRPVAMALSPDGTRFALATAVMNPSYVRMRSITEQKELWYVSHDGFYTRSLTFSPDGTTLTGIENDKAKQWDAATGEVLWAASRSIGLHSIITKLLPDRSGEKLYALSTDGNYSSLYIVQASDGTELPGPIPMRRSLGAVATSPTGDSHIISGAGFLQVIDAQTANVMYSIEGGADTLLYNHAGSHVAMYTYHPEQEAKVPAIMDSSLGSIVYPDISAMDHPVYPAAFSDDDSILLASWEKHLHQWSAATGEHLDTTDFPHDIVGISSDGTRLFTTDENDMIRIYEIAAMNEIFSLASPYPVAGVVKIRYSSDEKRLIGRIGSDRFIYDMERELYTFQGSLDFYRHDISPDGTIIASGSDFAYVDVWNAETQELLLSHACNRNDHSELPVGKVRFSTDGNTVFTGYGEMVFQMIDVSWLYERGAEMLEK